MVTCIKGGLLPKYTIYIFTYIYIFYTQRQKNTSCIRYLFYLSWNKLSFLQCGVSILWHYSKRTFSNHGVRRHFFVWVCDTFSFWIKPPIKESAVLYFSSTNKEILVSFLFFLKMSHKNNFNYNFFFFFLS